MAYEARRYITFIITLLLIGIIPGSAGQAQTEQPVSPDARVINLDQATSKTGVRADVAVSGQLLALTTIATPDEMASQAARTGLQLTARGVKTTVIAASDAAADRLMDALLNIGASDIERYSYWIDATIPVSSLEVAGQLPGVSLVQPVIQVFPLQQDPVTIGGNDTTTVSGNQAQVGQPNTESNAPSFSTLPNNAPSVNTGTVTSAGVAASNANAWHAAGITGRNVTVGVLDSFANLSAAQSAGDLPPNSRITIIGTLDTSSSHGVAVAEIIYDMAPDVDFILSSPTTAVEMANQITQMAQDGASIISSSVGFFNQEPGDGTGPVSDAITNVTNTYDVLVTQAAGNQATYNWQGTFDDSNNNNGYHEFPNGDEINRIYAEAGTYIALFMRWNSWPTTNQDYDILLFREDASSPTGLVRVGTGGNNFQDGDDPPVEFVSHTATQTGYYGWTISEYSGDSIPEVIDVMGYNSPNFEKNIEMYSLVDPATSAAVMGVSAVDAGSYNRMPYSSVGPAMESGGDIGTSGNQQPRIAGYTNVNTFSRSNFSGTSAAAPHVAGAAALVRSAQPEWSVSSVKTFLENRAVDLGDTGYDYSYGAGRLNLASPIAVEYLSNGSFNNGTTDWQFNGDINYNVNNGLLSFYNVPPFNSMARVFQQIDQPISTNTPLEVVMEVGNTSIGTKALEVVLRDSSPARTQFMVCAFSIPPNTPLTPIALRDITTADWEGATLLLRSTDFDNRAAITVDNVRVRQYTGGTLSGLDCDGFNVPPNRQLLRNGNVDEFGLRFWNFRGDIDYGHTLVSSDSGYMNFHRISDPGNQQAAVVYQESQYHIEANMPLEAIVRIGNSSNQARDVRLVLRDRENREVWDCYFNIPANTDPLTATPVRVRGVTGEEWGALTMVLNDLTTLDQPSIEVDQMIVVHNPNATITNQCFSNFSTSGTTTGEPADVTDTKAEPQGLPEIRSEQPAPPPESPADTDGSNQDMSDGMPTIPGF